MVVVFVDEIEMLYEVGVRWCSDELVDSRQ